MSSAMESPAYRRLLYSSAAVIFGVMGQAVARGWLARDLTGNNTGLGGVMLAFGIAMLIATPWGGVAADRFPKRTVLLVSVSLLVVSSLLVGLAVVADVVEYWMLLLASAVQATAFALFLPARIAFIADVVEPEAIGPAVVLNQTTQEAMRVIAPALAGVLIGLSWFGVGGVFLLSAATSTLACGVLLGLPPGVPQTASTRSPIAEMVDAFRYVRARPGLGLVALTTIGVVVIGFPYLTFLPTLADERFDVGAGGYGLMSGVAGFGAVVAGVVAPRRRWVVQRPWPTVAVSGGALGAALIALGLAGEFWLALVALLAVGAAGLVFQTTTQSLMLTLSDSDYHGRMQSMVVLGFSGFGLAALPLGLLADAVTLEVTIVAMGVVVLAVTAAFARKRLAHRRLVVAVEYI
ncbi:MAG TPA: MFS transporter [Ilumatobacteraceae bacterium]|nr:MFS transporter [Ilumatobacteraceae bacterium]